MESLDYNSITDFFLNFIYVYMYILVIAISHSLLQLFLPPNFMIFLKKWTTKSN